MDCKFIWCSCRNKANVSITDFACLGIFITQLGKYYKGDRFVCKCLQPFLYEVGWCNNTTMHLCCDTGEMKRAESIDSHHNGQPMNQTCFVGRYVVPLVTAQPSFYSTGHTQMRPEDSSHDTADSLTWACVVINAQT